jgi:hypothetical protein
MLWGAVLQGALALIDKAIPDKDEAAKIKLRVMEMENSKELELLKADTLLAQGQLETNKEEARSTSLFVSGWRPFIGWVCGAALAYQYVVRPLLPWFAAAFGYPLPPLPGLEGTLMELVLAMLGLGGLRSIERIKGKA